MNVIPIQFSRRSGCLLQIMKKILPKLTNILRHEFINIYMLSARPDYYNGFRTNLLLIKSVHRNRRYKLLVLNCHRWGQKKITFILRKLHIINNWTRVIVERDNFNTLSQRQQNNEVWTNKKYPGSRQIRNWLMYCFTRWNNVDRKLAGYF